jgi:hypothetical protein
MVFMAGEGSGASGSFFFFSHDNKLLVKTITSSDKNVFLRMLDAYVEHIDETNNQSLLARIYGVFTIITNQFRPINVIVMENTVQTHNRMYSFDLKGSLVSRKAPYYDDKILKDVNFLEMKKSMRLVSMGDTALSYLHNLIKKDSEFLCSQNIMDYSLLLVVEKIL